MCVCSAAWSFETAVSASSQTVCVCECVHVCVRPQGGGSLTGCWRSKKRHFIWTKDGALGFLNGGQDEERSRERTGTGNYCTVSCERVDDTFLER